MDRQFLISMFLLLILNCASCTKDNVLAPSSVDNIVNTSWRFIAFDSSGVITELDPADTIYLTFKQSRLIEGKSRGLCGNYYQGIYSIENNCLRLDSLISSHAVCPDSKYWDYYDTLQYVNSFRIVGSQLYLYYHSSRQRLIFEKI